MIKVLSQEEYRDEDGDETPPSDPERRIYIQTKLDANNRWWSQDSKASKGEHVRDEMANIVKFSMLVFELNSAKLFRLIMIRRDR